MQKRTTKSATKGDSRLDDYRSKRDPERTNEPFSPERNRSAGPTRSGRFVVHLHAATRTHYDLRLEIAGALESFAVPKGPSLDPAQKHLAVRTEPHPLEYLDFEEVIPDGNYGAGPMIVWDEGRVRYLDGTAEDGLARGKLDFELAGHKLRGRFALVYTGKRGARSREQEKPEWLLIKKQDAFSAAGRDVTADSPLSVLSGLSVEQLAERGAIASRIEQEAAELGAPRGSVDTRALVPMLCAPSGAKLDDPERLYELKLDGVRIVADKHGAQVALRYRNGRAATTTYPEIARAVRALAPERVVLDGEIVAFDAHGKPSFERLAPRIHARRPEDVARSRREVVVTYLVFDLLQIGERVLVDLPLRDRKRLLAEVVVGRGLIRALDHLEGEGRPLYDLCRAERLEGLVAKRSDSKYRPGPGRGSDWVKIKCERDDEFVIVGYIEGRGGRKRLGALDLASYVGDRLVVRGKVGSGLDDRAIDALLERLAPLEVDAQPAEGELSRESGKRHFVKPELVASVRFLGWTSDGHLRAPVFRGLREDVEARSCAAAPPAETLARPADEPVVDEPVAAATRVVVSNRDKVFWPDDGYTKGDLCDYYASVSSALLPFLRARPVVLVRYPDGIEGKHFFQWNAPRGTPDWIRTLQLRDDEDAVHHQKCVFLVDDVDSLLHIVNLGSIPLHVLASRSDSLDHCDFITFDFDIGEQPFKHAVTLALALRELLEDIGLSGFPKTSGQSGLHVLVPLGPGVGFDVAKMLVELLGRLVVDRYPGIATMERRVSKRGPRVYVDTGQTGRSRTIVAPWSVRAWPGASVSTPLAWEELHLALDPTRFTIATVPARLAELGDPMRTMLDARPDVARAVARLERRVRG